ncbi:MAG: hydrophobe/amphiphile efflux-1 family RND transporter [Sneathiella sp.]|uniref:efflux RND transporter permease subunit n=1 Tax=Sneathiella sp. TaxID=1964365 RepID=UPI000C5A700B|nr:efflux RND transporter permease subunit [Sneathiella sp.]MAL78579.1 hydrophobe/amphiphile efflux-1 family RND transporter [Sneathiella sp.]
MIYDFFIRRPKFALVLSIVITLAGILSMYVIPVSQYPEITPPTVQVSTSYAGANAKVVADTVAQPIESAVNGVDNMLYMKSVSNSDGSYALTISFAVGTDPDLATVNTQTRVSQALSLLPDTVQQNGVTVRKQSNSILQIFGFYSDDASLDQLLISNYLTINVIDQLKRIPGVGDASVLGASTYAMRIWIDNPTLMSNLSLTNQDIINAIQRQNIQAPAGRLGAPPVSDNQSLQLIVTTKGRLSSAEEFGNIILRAQADGSIVRLRDVARVELGAQSAQQEVKLGDAETAGVAIYLAPGANAVVTAKAVDEKIAELSERFPASMTYRKFVDSAEFVDDMITKVIETLLEAFALVAIVVFVFLGRFRATIIPLFAVPVAIIGAIAVIYLFGYTANIISLLALVLAIGIVVDDAIIVVENVERVMEEDPHLTPAQAAKKAMNEIAGSIIAITFVLLAVFVPVAILPGSSGVLFRQFAIAISAAMVISAINALTLSPALCALFLRPGKPIVFMRPVTGFINRIGDGYAGLIKKLVRVSVLSIVVAIGFGAIAGYGVKTTPAGFVPEEDKGYVMIIFQLPAGASFNRTIKVAEMTSKALEGDPAVNVVGRVTGLDLLSGSIASNAGVVFINLKPYAERTTPEMSSTAVLMRAMQKLSGIAEATFIPINPPAIDGLGNAGGFEYVLQALQGQEPSEMGAVLRNLLVASNQNPHIAAAFSTFEANTPQVSLDIDRDKAMTLGVEIADVFGALQSQLGGYYVNDFNLFGRTWTVYVQGSEEYRSSIDDIYDIQIRNSDGEMVPVSSFTEAKLISGPRQITRYNNYEAASVIGNPAPDSGIGVAMTEMEAISAESLPSGYAYEWTGLALQQVEAAGKTSLVIGLAFVFAYLFLVALYESWSIPVAILASVIVAVVGAVAGIRIAGLSFDLYAQIGIVVLIALAAKNAILINTFALEQRNLGHPLAQSASDGARLRFRPVMMTSFAFIMGLVPLVIAKGAGAGAMVALGIPVFAGMLAAATVGMILIPMLYVSFQWLREKAGWRPIVER